MSFQRWTFTDTSTAETATFSINPKDHTEPVREKNFGYQMPTAPDGEPIFYESPPKPQEMSWKGTLLTTAQRDMFDHWFDKSVQVRVTNDFGESWMIYITKFAPKRKHVVSRQYAAEYDLTATVINLP